MLIPGGRFWMGDEHGEGYVADGEVPVHEVVLDDFYLDESTVTVSQFATFVKSTGYVTDAEDLGVSAVFHAAVRADPQDVLHRLAEAPWWVAVRGASWRHPQGRGSVAVANHPAVHVTWNDAHAFAIWAGKRLPTEAEWEYAARGGLSASRFPWGDVLKPGARWQCNIFQGDFPHVNTAEDGYETTAPAKSFRPNGYGLYNMVGNVWEWCADWFQPDYYQHSPTTAPPGPSAGDRKVFRGGSYLCHDSYCYRYRVSARSSNFPDSTSANVGFRCANDASTADTPRGPQSPPSQGVRT
ncbi:formylglycine-generating enzyme family protein [Streptosporangium sp. NPDC049644]|uniref:formylglycine-generating enzyme family protein n=1 Tax=Streptosporangium sp. NPDC049644 TaxID=3155507 RepID=UPI00341235B1